MAELAEYLMRYIGAPVTAFQASDTVVGVTAVDRSPVGAAVAADAEGTGSNARTSSSSSTPAARRPTSLSGRAPGIETFTFFQLLLTRHGSPSATAPLAGRAAVDGPKPLPNPVLSCAVVKN